MKKQTEQKIKKILEKLFWWRINIKKLKRIGICEPIYNPKKALTAIKKAIEEE